MAAILARSYEDWYKPSTTRYTFKDVNPASEFYKSINQLANNNVTLATEYFKPGDKVTRGHFALFLARSAKLKP